MSDATSRLIEQLARDLEPVRRVPRLQHGVLAVGSLAAVSGALALILGGFRADLPRLVAQSLPYNVLLASLALVGASGVLAVLAASIPGREVLARASLSVAVAALLTALGSAVAQLGLAASPLPAEAGLFYDAACLAHSCGVALLPACAGVALVSRGAPFRPLAIVAGTAAASVGAGAMFVHLSCDCDGLRHLLVSHAGAPLLGGLLLTLPLYAAFIRLRRRS
jgi:hypothetical protein